MKKVMTIVLMAVVLGLCASGSPRLSRTLRKPKIPAVSDIVSPGDSIEEMGLWTLDTLSRQFDPISPVQYRAPVFGRYLLLDTVALPALGSDGVAVWPETTEWLADELFRQHLLARVKQRYMLANPSAVVYNEAFLPEPPDFYTPVVEPAQHKITIAHIPVSEAIKDANITYDVSRKNWIHQLNASLQFSQSYISPNWYQGGTGNLNLIANFAYNIKLNQAFHPNLLCEVDVNYRLAVNNAPTDTVHSYNISEDNLRVTGRFGFKAWRRWFYSLNVLFKTQLFNSYAQNSTVLQSAILSPGELNLGLGMTYSRTSPSGNFSIECSLSPAAWNMKTCTNRLINPVPFGIEEGHTVVNQLGINTETKMTWKIVKNISLTSRFYAFSDYNYVQGDLEATLQFDILRFLSTKLYAHLRYDSSTVPLPDTKWRYWQLKEILSLGFSYSFSS